MVTKKKKVATPHASAKLDEPLARKNREELITVTRHPMDNIKAALEYPNTPTVQAGVTAPGTTTDAFDKTVSLVGEKKAELTVLLGTRDTQHQAMLRDRSLLREVITNASQGSPDAIKAGRCFVNTPASRVPTQDPPEHLTLKNSKATPGALEGKCKAAPGAGSYVFAVSTDAKLAPARGDRHGLSGSRGNVPRFGAGALRAEAVSTPRSRRDLLPHGSGGNLRVLLGARERQIVVEVRRKLACVHVDVHSQGRAVE